MLVVLTGRPCSPRAQQVFTGSTPQIGTVIGVLAKQGEFLGLFSFDNQAIVPLNVMRKYFGARMGIEIRVKVKDKTRMTEASDELVGAMRRVRAQLLHAADGHDPPPAAGDHPGQDGPRAQEDAGEIDGEAGFVNGVFDGAAAALAFRPRSAGFCSLASCPAGARCGEAAPPG